MVAYQPPDSVLISVGACQKVEPLIRAGRRLSPLVQKDQPHLAPFGIDEESVVGLKRVLNDLSGMSRDRRIMKNDNPVQMTEVQALMAQIRAWMQTLRLIGGLNLALDGPALSRLASAAPELAEGYPRDLLEDLSHRLQTASDLKPRLEEVGLDDAFLGRGRKMRAQLQTAIGKDDINGENLSLQIRRFYSRKAQAFLTVKRISRAGRLAFARVPRRAALYHLDEIEPPVLEPATRAVRPKRPAE